MLLRVIVEWQEQCGKECCHFSCHFCCYTIRTTIQNFLVNFTYCGTFKKKFIRHQCLYQQKTSNMSFTRDFSILWGTIILVPFKILHLDRHTPASLSNFETTRDLLLVSSLSTSSRLQKTFMSSATKSLTFHGGFKFWKLPKNAASQI